VFPITNFANVSFISDVIVVVVVVIVVVVVVVVVVKGLGPLDLAVDPVDEVAGLGVDARISGDGAAVTPRDDSAVDAIAGHRAAGVSLKVKVCLQELRKFCRAMSRDNDRIVSYLC
jgi:hypothetical protein